jgi:tetratricopeptide (TPR) repeat protein
VGKLGLLDAVGMVVAILVWFLPAFLFHGRGEDWRAWLIVGPFATLVIVVMITVTYGLAASSRRDRDEMPLQHTELAQDRQGEASTMSVQALQHLNLAYDHEDGDEFTSALRECETAIRFDPGHAEAHNLRGIVLEELGRKGEAIAAYAQAVRLDPSFDEARENLYEAKAEQGSAHRESGRAMHGSHSWVNAAGGRRSRQCWLRRTGPSPGNHGAG